MTHAPGHIICGTAGHELGLFVMKVHRGSVLTLGIRYREENAIDHFGLSEKKARKLGERINKHVHRIYEELKKEGIPVQYHKPLPENLDPPPAE